LLPNIGNISGPYDVPEKAFDQRWPVFAPVSVALVLISAVAVLWPVRQARALLDLQRERCALDLKPMLVLALNLLIAFLPTVLWP